MTTRVNSLKAFYSPQRSHLPRIFSHSRSMANSLAIILARIKPPRFPNRTFNLNRFGAKPDGRTDCTIAFRNAINQCSKAGGGKVFVPPGTYLTGAIHLKSNVNLEISEGATIKFSQNPKDYLPVVSRAGKVSSYSTTRLSSTPSNSRTSLSPAKEHSTDKATTNTGGLERSSPVRLERRHEPSTPGSQCALQDGGRKACRCASASSAKAIT